MSDHDSFFGVRIQVDRSLAGSKHAFQFGDGPILVSPAMYELISTADEAELRTLLETIRVKHLPPMSDLDLYNLPMLTTRPNFDWESRP